MSVDLDNVRVAVRVRPLVESEVARGSQIAVEKVPQSEKVLVNNTDAFTYNFVFDGKESQEDVYRKTVAEMIDRLFAGFNATILAYGQTGSGKTYTMGTAFDGCLDEDIGVIPRAMQDIFERIEKKSDQTEFLVKCSFMELYQEQLYDLLSTKSKDESVVELREDRSGVFFVGLTEELVRSAKETTNCLLRGSLGRAVGATAMNQHSSRSHAIFTVIIQATSKIESQNVTTSKFHLVDLAGSERLKKIQFSEERGKDGMKMSQDFTGISSTIGGNNSTKQVKGDRFKEGVKINQGLLALGNVISALGDGKGGGFVRYRDSKLTRLLQDSLGGNSVTLMIACVSPADYNVAETLSTLRYADRARKIKNKPIINQDPHAAEINRLKGIIQKLRGIRMNSEIEMSSSFISELDEICPNGNTMAMSMQYNPLDVETLCPSPKDIQEKYDNLQLQWYVTINEVAEHEIRANIMENTQDRLKELISEAKRSFSNLDDLDCDSDKMNRTLRHLRNVLDSLESEIVKSEMKIKENKRSVATNTTMDVNYARNCPREIYGLMQEQTEAFVSKQMDINEQLHRLNHELNLKEQLHHRMSMNFSKYHRITENYLKPINNDLNLEHEKTSLNYLQRDKKDKLNTLIEESTKRLQNIDLDGLNGTKKSIVHDDHEKIREFQKKELLKITKLNDEIQLMKENKMKLVRTMLQENENFRQFKLIRKRELLEERYKDQRLRTTKEVALKHNTEKVLERSLEDAIHINNRLRELLERQKVTRRNREQIKNMKEEKPSAAKLDLFLMFLEREYDVMVSLVNGQITVEHLSVDQSIINERIEERKHYLEENNPNDADVLKEIDTLEQALEKRNALIDKMKEIITEADLESQISSIVDNLDCLLEARAATKLFLEKLLNMQRVKNQSLQQLRTELRATKDESSQLIWDMENMKISHQHVLHDYEEKIHMMLTPEQRDILKHQKEQQKIIDRLTRKVDNYAQLLESNQLQSSTIESKSKRDALNRLSKQQRIVIDSFGEIYGKRNDLKENYNPHNNSDNNNNSSPVEDKSNDETLTDNTLSLASASASASIKPKLKDTSKINFNMKSRKFF